MFCKEKGWIYKEQGEKVEEKAGQLPTPITHTHTHTTHTSYPCIPMQEQEELAAQLEKVKAAYAVRYLLLGGVVLEFCGQVLLEWSVQL